MTCKEISSCDCPGHPDSTSEKEPDKEKQLCQKSVLQALHKMEAARLECCF